MHRQVFWRTGLWATALVAVFAVTGNAAAQLWTGASSADDLQYRLGVIDAELADIRARLTGVPSTGGGTAATGVGGDAMVRLARLEAEIQRLTGKLEQMAFEQRQIAEDAARRFGDIEFRLTELEGGDISALAPVAPLGGGGVGTVVAAGPEVSISERNDLDRAIKDVEKGRFDQGEDRLQSFLTAYPGSPLKGEALYWLGESQFVRGAYQNAARSYLDGYNFNRASNSAPRNLYRLGVTLGRLGQISEAGRTLHEVRKQFPNGPADVLDSADAESGTLKCG